MFSPEFESMPLTKLKELQLARLKWSVRHAYENNPFYRKKFDEAKFHPGQLKSLDDISRVPFLLKQEMRDNYPYGLFATSMNKVVRLHSSSGTTGNATVVGYTKNDVDLWATLMARTITAAGGSEDDILQVAYGYGLFTGGLGAHYSEKRSAQQSFPFQEAILIASLCSSGISERQCSHALHLTQSIWSTLPPRICLTLISKKRN